MLRALEAIGSGLAAIIVVIIIFSYVNFSYHVAIEIEDRTGFNAFAAFMILAIGPALGILIGVLKYTGHI